LMASSARVHRHLARAHRILVWSRANPSRGVRCCRQLLTSPLLPSQSPLSQLLLGPSLPSPLLLSRSQPCRLQMFPPLVASCHRASFLRASQLRSTVPMPRAYQLRCAPASRCRHCRCVSRPRPSPLQLQSARLRQCLHRRFSQLSRLSPLSPLHRSRSPCRASQSPHLHLRRRRRLCRRPQSRRLRHFGRCPRQSQLHHRRCPAAQLLLRPRLSQHPRPLALHPAPLAFRRLLLAPRLRPSPPPRPLALHPAPRALRRLLLAPRLRPSPHRPLPLPLPLHPALLSRARSKPARLTCFFNQPFAFLPQQRFAGVFFAP